MKKVGLGPTPNNSRKEEKPLPLDALNNPLPQPVRGSATRQMATSLQERAQKLLNLMPFDSASARISKNSFPLSSRPQSASFSSSHALPPDHLPTTTAVLDSTPSPKSWVNLGSSEISSLPTISIDFSDIDLDQENIEQTFIERLYQTLQSFSSQAENSHLVWHSFLSTAPGSVQPLITAKPISLAPSNLDALVDWLRDFLEKSAGLVALEFNNVSEEVGQSDKFKDFLDVLNEVGAERSAGQNGAEKLPGAQLIVTQANP